MEKILFVLGGNVYPYNVGGMEVFNYYLIQALRKQFTISYNAYWPLNISGIKFKRSFHIKPVKFFFPIQLFIHLLLEKDIKKVVFSYSAAHWIVWNLYRKICKVLNRKYYIVIHYGDVTPNIHEKSYEYFFKDAEAVIAVSEDIKKNYDKKYGLNCKVIYPLVPFALSPLSKKELRIKYHLPIEARIICMVGSVKGMKNPDTILRTIHLFTERERQDYHFHVVFAGSGSLIDKLKKMSVDYGIENCVTFLGNIPKDEVRDIYKLSDFYLIASDFEGTSVSLLEAMFNRMPIIASRVPGITNTIKEDDECLMFSVQNAEELKQCILSYILYPELADRLSLNAYEHYVREYNYANVISSYSEILSSK